MFILIFIIILAILIVSHEFGHFIVAKLSGIRVDEFGLGFPPRVVGKRWGQTTYTLNWIPFGGFVKIFGEDPTSLEENDELRGARFDYKPRIVQAGVVVAGIVFNVLLAFVLLWIGLTVGLQASTSSFPTGQYEDVHVVVTEVVPGSPAALAKVPAGIQIVELSSGTDVQKIVDADEVVTFMGAHTGKPVSVVAEEGTYVVVPSPTAGLRLDDVGTVSFGVFGAFVPAIKTTGFLLVGTAKGMAGLLWSLVHGTADLANVSGPVGIASIVKQAAGIGFGALLQLTVLLSLSLAVVNVIPFPALDGGRLLFIIIESIRRRPLPKQIANYANTAGFALLLVLMVLITYHDIARLL